MTSDPSTLGMISPDKAKFLEIFGITAFPEVGTTLGAAADLGVISDTEFQQVGSVGDDDPKDVYRFELLEPARVNLTLSGLTADADLEVIQDRNGNLQIDPGEIIAFSENFGTTPENIDILLDSGEYFTRVRQFEGDTSYLLGLSATPVDLPPDSAGNTLAEARVIDDLTDTRVFNEFVGAIDPVDYYRFTLDETQLVNIQLDGLSSDIDLELIEDRNEDGIVQPDEVLAFSRRPGVEPEQISRELEAGTYFIRVFPFDGDSFYNLTVDASVISSEIGNTLPDAFDIGSLTGPQTFEGTVSSLVNDADVYRFTLDTPSRIEVDLTGLSADADIEVIQDVNNTGEVNPGDGDILTFSEEPGTLPERIETLLDSGTYFVRVLPFESRTDYTLSLNSTPADLPVDTAGNTLAEARDLGQLDGPLTISEFVGSIDFFDYYRFSLDEPTTVDLSLTGLSADADLELIRTVNEDGTSEDEEVIALSQRPGIAPEQISEDLEAGTYFVRVLQFRGDTTYDLNLTPIAIEDELLPPEDELLPPEDELLPPEDEPVLPPEDGVGNTLADALVIDLSTPQTFQEFVSSETDPADVYRFELLTPSRLEVTLTDLVGDADIEVIKDRDQTNQVDPGDVLTFSENPGLADERIDTLLDSGTYFVRVLPFESDTTYTLNISAEPAELPEDGAGNTFAEARDLGVLEGEQVLNDFVGSIDFFDYYRFVLESQSRVILTMKDLEADADLELLRDEEVLQFSNAPGTLNERIDGVFEPGEYFIRVSQFQGDTTYSLTAEGIPIEAPPEEDRIGNTLATAFDLGDLISRRSVTEGDFIGLADRQDYYRFDLSQSSNIEVKLSGLEADADLILLADNNNNGIFDRQDETIQISSNQGAETEEIEVTGLNAGVYYVLVEYPFGQGINTTNEGTNYTISFAAKEFTAPPPVDTVSRAYYAGHGLIDAADAVATTVRRNRFSDVSYFQDEPGFNDLADWGLNAIYAPNVWAQGYTGSGMTVAVLDDGIDTKHPEFAESLSSKLTWRNFPLGNKDLNDPSPQFEEVQFEDDDGNIQTRPGELESHGTHVAGTVAANRDGRGIAGVAYDSDIMPVRVLGRASEGVGDTLVKGIFHAVDNGAHVINMSLGVRGNDLTQDAQNQTELDNWREALEYARDNGVIVTISAGNNRDRHAPGLVTKPAYPARFAEDGLAVAVGNSTRDGYIRYDSNPAGHNFQNFVTAPGDSIISSIPQEQWGFKGGTSMAAPHVAGTVALMVEAFYEANGLNPQTDRLSPQQVDRIYQILNTTADGDAIVGYEEGRIDPVTNNLVAFEQFDF